MCLTLDSQKQIPGPKVVPFAHFTVYSMHTELIENDQPFSTFVSLCSLTEVRPFLHVNEILDWIM